MKRTGGDLGGGQQGTVPPRKLEVEGTEMFISPPISCKYHYKFTVSTLFGGAEKLNIIMPPVIFTRRSIYMHNKTQTNLS